MKGVQGESLALLSFLFFSFLTITLPLRKCATNSRMCIEPDRQKDSGDFV